VPPHNRNVSSKIGKELVDGCESVGIFEAFDVFVIAFAPFIVVAYEALSRAAKKEGIFEAMRSLFVRFRYFPNPDLDNRAIRIISPRIIK
jgi:hypothetical protein